MSRRHGNPPAAQERPAMEEGAALHVDPQRFPADGYGIAPDWWKRFLLVRLVMELGSNETRKNPLAQSRELYLALEEENFGAQTPDAAPASDRPGAVAAAPAKA